MSKVRGLAFASLLTVGLGGSTVGLIAGASGAFAATDAPTSSAAACTKADVIIVSRNANLTDVSVRLAAASAQASCDVSLHAYQTDGPTWPTSGTQSEVGFATIHLTTAAQSLSVTGSPCFGQNELVIGTQRFDGTDGALPHFPNGVFGASTLAKWNGGTACTQPSTPPPSTPPPSTPPTNVLPEQFVAPQTAAPLQVLGETFVAPAAPKAQLPFTGQPIAAEIAAGAMLIGIGALLIAAGRRSETDNF
jgi:hypothetical protein